MFRTFNWRMAFKKLWGFFRSAATIKIFIQQKQSEKEWEG
ncbi:hypothetical protein NEOC65_002341 [Neochlamydia sp. AcF65]|nr:hypothetical protein [Neochlamydia sp. AcF65]